MTDNEIIKEATEAYRQDLDAGCYVGDLLGIIKRQQEEIKELKRQIENIELEAELEWEREVMQDDR